MGRLWALGRCRQAFDLVKYCKAHGNQHPVPLGSVKHIFTHAVASRHHLAPVQSSSSLKLCSTIPCLQGWVVSGHIFQVDHQVS